MKSLLAVLIIGLVLTGLEVHKINIRQEQAATQALAEKEAAERADKAKLQEMGERADALLKRSEDFQKNHKILKAKSTR